MVAEFLLRDRDPLNLDHHRRIGEAGDRDRSAGRKIAAENLGADLSHARGVARVDQKHRHGDEVGELRAGFGQGALDVAKGLPALGIEVPASDLPPSSV